jgi:hypothetical protein
MRGVLFGVTTLLAVLIGHGQAGASPISMTWGPDTYDPIDVLINNSGAVCTTAPTSGSCVSLDYVHDLTVYGFVPGVSSGDQLTNGTLELFLRDDSASDSADNFKYTLELNQLGQLTSGTQHGSLTLDFVAGLNSASLATMLLSIQADGLLNVRIRQQGGPNSDLIFEKSVFTAYGTRYVDDADDRIEVQGVPVPIPEPASLVLVGTGLAAGLSRRRRRSRV